MDGLNVQVTAVLVAPPTMAVNCWLCKAANVAEGGVREMPTVGLSVTVALAALLESATLVTVMVTIWALAIEAGAVYRPTAVMLPTSGLIDHMTALLPVLVTVAEKLWT